MNISPQEAQDILDQKDEPSSSVEASSAQSPKRASPISKEQRKILTPKGTVTNPFKTPDHYTFLELPTYRSPKPTFFPK